jgi:hypothetical protein
MEQMAKALSAGTQCYVGGSTYKSVAVSILSFYDLGLERTRARARGVLRARVRMRTMV